MLGGHRDDVAPPRESRLTQALNGQVVGFGGAAGEHHRVGRNRQAARQALTGKGQLGCGFQARAMAAAGGIGKGITPPRRHRLHHRRITGRGGLMVEVDRRSGHGGSSPNAIHPMLAGLRWISVMVRPAWLLAALAGLLSSSAALAQGFVFETKQQNPANYRPPGLKILSQRAVPYGEEVVGIYAIRDAEDIPDGKRIKIWRERANDVKVANETIRCDTTAPMRITGRGDQMLMLELNPGGAVGPHNEESHLIWWAACVPEQTGKDPNSLQAIAQDLGFSGLLIERQHVLPGRPR